MLYRRQELDLSFSFLFFFLLFVDGGGAFVSLPSVPYPVTRLRAERTNAHVFMQATCP